MKIWNIKKLRNYPEHMWQGAIFAENSKQEYGKPGKTLKILSSANRN